MAEKENNLVEIGALWVNEPKGGGTKYLSGKLGAAVLLVFKNTHKKDGSKEPDYRVYVAPQKKPEGSGGGKQQQEEGGL